VEVEGEEVCEVEGEDLEERLKWPIFWDAMMDRQVMVVGLDIWAGLVWLIFSKVFGVLFVVVGGTVGWLDVNTKSVRGRLLFLVVFRN